MICFRDMTFCTFYEDCTKGDVCHRCLTHKVEEEARAWWGGNGSIATYVNKPGCYEQIHAPIKETKDA